ncbi:MAG: transporter substrate-binding domain-containing protein [Pseudomonadota bacterium]
MIKMGWYIYMAVVIVLFLGTAPCHALTVLTEEIPPLSATDSGRPAGFSVDIAAEILKRLGIDAPVHVQPWVRAYKTALETPNVVLFSVARTPEREEKFNWIGPLLVSHNGFYARKGHGLHIKTLDDVRRVGAIATYRADARDQELTGQVYTNLDRSDSPDACLKKLLGGRVDLWLFNSLSLPEITRRNGAALDDLELVIAYRQYDLYITLSRGTPDEVVEQWTRTLDAVKADGTFARLAVKWLPKDSTPRWVAAPSLLGYPRPAMTLYTEDAPPGSYVEHGEIKGFSVAIVREILRRLSLPDTITVVPWARGYQLAQTTPEAGVFSTSRIPQRESLFKWVGPLYRQQWGLYARKDRAIVINRLEDARQAGRIGTYRQDAKEQYLRDLGFTNLVSATANTVNIRHLLNGSIDLWASSDFNMPYLARQAYERPEAFKNVFTFKRVDNFIAFNPNTPDHVVTAWQKTLDDIKAEGQYERLYEDLVRLRKPIDK